MYLKPSFASAQDYVESKVLMYKSNLEKKFSYQISNHWFWVVLFFILIVAFFVYAFYCTSRGYSFNGNVRVRWPRVWETSIGCKR